MSRNRKRPSALLPAPVPPPEASLRADSWQNAVTGLGTSIDALTRASVVSNRTQWQNPATLETLYYEDDFIAKGVDAIVDDAMRHGFDIELRSDDVDPGEAKARTEKITRRLRSLQAYARITEAAKWGRLYGGGALFIGSDQGEPKQVLNPNLPGKIRFLATMERRELYALEWASSFDSPIFGRPQTWAYYPTGLMTSEHARVIDASRLLTFEGLPVSKNERAAQAGWSLSIVTRVYEIVRDGQQNWRSMCLILQQMHQAVFKMKNLVSMIASGQGDTLARRMEIVNLARSISRAVLVDADSESFDYHSANVSGLSDLLDKTWQRLASAFDMPVTRLMGMSPAGMNATGESDQTNWYDRVQAYRESMLEPQIERLVHVVAAEQGDPNPGDWFVKWPSLWQMSPTEEATYRKTIAETDAIYLGEGVVTPEEISVSRFVGGWSAETHVDLEMRAAPKPGDEALAYGGVTAETSTPTATEAPAPPVDAPVAAETPTVTPDAPASASPDLAKDPAAALNGAQVASLQGIVASVAERTLPRESGIAMMLAAFPITEVQAENIMGEVGRSFFAPTEPTPGA